MEEFAGALGLSRSTVSYILNDKWQDRHISEKTALKVQEFARKVNFTPSLFGRALKGKICTDAAILIPPHMYEHHRDTFFALLDLFEQQELSYLVLPLRANRGDEITVRQLQTFRVSRVIIFAATLNSDELNQWEKVMRSLPEINWFLYDHRMEYGLNREFFPDNVQAVGFDRIAAFKMLIRHVGSKGYSKLCYRAPFYTDDQTAMVADEAGLELHGIAAGKSWEEFADKVEGELKNCCSCALFFPDDLCAIKLIQLLQVRRWQIPGDAGVISWDGLQVSSHFAPVPETLAIPHDRMRLVTEKFLAGEDGGFEELHPEIRAGKTLPELK